MIKALIINHVLYDSVVKKLLTYTELSLGFLLQFLLYRVLWFFPFDLAS
jgi:hypothetical protein